MSSLVYCTCTVRSLETQYLIRFLSKHIFLEFNNIYYCVEHNGAWCSNIYFFLFFFSFTLYPACSRVDRGSLVIRHSAPNFPLNSGGVMEFNASLYLGSEDDCFSFQLNTKRINICKLTIYLNIKGQSAALSSATLHTIPRKFGWKLRELLTLGPLCPPCYIQGVT